jgi:hypothetical protein
MSMRRCAFCDGRLGLISHRKGILRFCKLVHKSAYAEREREQQKVEHRRKLWFDFLSRRLLSCLIFGATNPAT